jgi:putative oxidoreductase
MKTWAPLIGRVLLVAIFVMSGIGKIMDPANTTAYMTAAGMPMASMFLVLAILAELGGSISVLLGYKTRWGALLLIVFTIPATLIFHTHLGDKIQMIMFMKNISMLGGLTLLLAGGPGAWSLDAKRSAD